MRWRKGAKIVARLGKDQHKAQRLLKFRKCRHEAEFAIQSATFTSRDALGGVTDKSETFADSVTL